jgi:hypothetical protein
MHPDQLHMIATLRIREDRDRARIERLRTSRQRARPPGRLRHAAASALVRLAARLADDAVQPLPRRA